MARRKRRPNIQSNSMPQPSTIPTLRGPRVILRRWRQSDRDAFAAMNADPSVMEFMLKRLSREESDAYADRIEAHLAERGFGLWAVEIPGLAEFAGFIGLWPAKPEIPCAPAVEIGYRLAEVAWGKGYATEGARLALAYAFEVAGLKEVVSFTAVLNTRSQRVMQRLGLVFSGTFDHPSVPEGNPLRPHVLHRITEREWRWNQRL
jgi:RimJ/RimL family protein N-acetyltransferase